MVLPDLIDDFEKISIGDSATLSAPLKCRLSLEFETMLPYLGVSGTSTLGVFLMLRWEGPTGDDGFSCVHSSFESTSDVSTEVVE